MFREIRRKKQELSAEECEQILCGESSGVLALSGDDGYPYAVPLSYVYSDGRLYFHSAVQGHKLDAIARCDKASFCVISRDEVIPSDFTTLYKSVIVFGRVRVMEDEAQLHEAMKQLGAKYSSGFENECALHIQRQREHYVVLELCPEHISGKQANPIY